MIMRSRERRAARMLLQLDDHLLRDIGLRRTDLRAGFIVRGERKHA
jgi:uncharacterized protein YjiS (DUF1127 family)